MRMEVFGFFGDFLLLFERSGEKRTDSEFWDQKKIYIHV